MQISGTFYTITPYSGILIIRVLIRENNVYMAHYILIFHHF